MSDDNHSKNVSIQDLLENPRLINRCLDYLMGKSCFRIHDVEISRRVVVAAVRSKVDWCCIV
jgi:hypothetical protein